MYLRNAIVLLTWALLGSAPFAQAENGSAGWLRYAPLSPRAAQLYKKIPRRVVAITNTPIARNAANELIRGVHSMLGNDLRLASESSTFAAEDSFVLGTPAEIYAQVPAWKAAG